MTTLKNRASRGAMTLTLTTAALAFAGTASAGDCSSNKAKKTATYTAVPATQVMSTSAQSNIVYAGYAGKTKNKGTIVDAAVATDSLSTLVAAATAADLVDTLASPGPFTVFAPQNTAFDALPEGKVAKLLKPKNKAKLQGILKAHVVAGNLNAADITKLAQQNGGSVDVQTVSGDTLTAILSGDTL